MEHCFAVNCLRHIVTYCYTVICLQEKQSEIPVGECLPGIVKYAEYKYRPEKRKKTHIKQCVSYHVGAN